MHIVLQRLPTACTMLIQKIPGVPWVVRFPLTRIYSQYFAGFQSCRGCKVFYYSLLKEREVALHQNTAVLHARHDVGIKMETDLKWNNIYLVVQHDCTSYSMLLWASLKDKNQRLPLFDSLKTNPCFILQDYQLNQTHFCKSGSYSGS